RGAPTRLRDPRDRARPPVASVYPPRLDPRPPLLMLSVLELEGIRVVHGERAVLDVPALDVKQGQILAVIGPTGAGKSTLLRVLGLRQPATGGAVRFHGAVVPPGGALGRRRRMASVFQDPLLADATVFDNVALGLRFRHVARREVASRVRPWLD